MNEQDIVERIAHAAAIVEKRAKEMRTAESYYIQAKDEHDKLTSEYARLMMDANA